MLEAFQVVDIREEEVQEIWKGVLWLWEVLVHHQTEQVREIVAAVETDPGDLVVQDQAGKGRLLCEIDVGDAPLLEHLEVDAWVFKEVDWGLGLSIGVNVESEVELPGANWLGMVALFIRQGDTYLDNLGHVHICFYLRVFSIL